MVSPVNGAGSQASALVNPFEQKPDQQNRIKSDDPSKPKETGNNLTVESKRPRETTLAQSQSATGQDNKVKTQGRGALVNITA
jgi:hypothetical protein